MKKNILLAPSYQYFKEAGYPSSFFDIFIKSLLPSYFFDADYYRENNEDVAEACSSDQELHAHYLKNGWFEGRLPFNVVVDEAFYLNIYPDIHDSDLDSQEHFLASGYAEGRIPFMPNEINIEFYNAQLIANGKDVVSTLDEAQEHYITEGYVNLYIPSKSF